MNPDISEVPIYPEKKENTSLFLLTDVVVDDPVNVPEINKTTANFSFNKSKNEQYFLRVTASNRILRILYLSFPFN